MASCRDCIHYRLCERIDAIFEHYNIQSPIHLHSTCSDFFKNKADVVEVVRCCDCKHRNPYCYRCMRDNLWHDTNDFCSYGERSETNAE